MISKSLRIVQSHDGRQKFRGVLVLVALMVMIGCAGPYGKLIPSQEINAVFKSYRPLADHRYFITGPEGRPDAIMGIQRDYTLETSLWIEFDPSDGTLKKWVDAINFYQLGQAGSRPYGYEILGPDGNRIGIYYSIWDWTTVIVDTDNRIEIYPPLTREPFGNDDPSIRMPSD